MNYPSFAEYSDALLLSLDVVLSDPLLGRGTLRTHGPGLPVAHSGNFALTYEVVVDGRTYAVRCFLKPSDSLQLRYEALADRLRSIQSPYFVDFEFQPCGITTAAGTYPIVRMEWAEGQTLAAFVAGHLDDAGALQELRVSLRELARHLGENGIAHGDIQPTNIIVQDAANLRLIDYDGVFVPELAQTPSTELGQPNFQHPERRAWHFDASLDAFSFSLIDLALDALCRRPALWDQTGSNEDTFLLRAADLADPASSPVFSVLASVPGLEQRVRHLAAISISPFGQIPAFEDFLAGRNIPEVSLVFSGDATRPLPRRYVSSHEVVDASNFQRCCAHVGERIELVGRIVRVEMHGTPELDATCLRVAFGEHSQDMACLKIWPDALGRMEQVPDSTWVGQWISAIGLVEPVSSAGSGAHRRMEVAISITEQTQLQWLTEAEARYRLGGSFSRTAPLQDTTPDAPAEEFFIDAEPLHTAPRSEPHPEPRLAPGTALQPASRSTPLPPPPARPSRWQWMVATAMIAALTIIALILAQSSHERAPQARLTGGESLAVPVLKTPVRPAGDGAISRLVSQQNLDAVAVPVVTAAGTLLAGSAGDGGQARVVLLDGDPIPGLRDDAITLVHRTVYSDRDVVVGFTQCNGTATPCGLRRPFWLELRAGLPPDVRRAPGLWASSGAGSVAASGDGVRVDLGLWNGERRNATLTASGNILVARTREASRPLNRADCSSVAQAAEACARSRDCSSFASSAQRIAPPQLARLTRLYHETTGLDGAAFRALCVRSCQLGLTPSRGFIRNRICSGAPSDQWPASNPAADLVFEGR
jgi:hypothetical protein